jgi:hypothetical protein
MTAPDDAARTRVVLRPVATSLPLGFLALAFATTVFAALQLGWIPPEEGRVAAITALVATVPLQLTASIVGFSPAIPWRRRGWGCSPAPGPRSA